MLTMGALNDCLPQPGRCVAATTSTSAMNIKVRGQSMDDIGMRITPKIDEGRTFTPGTDEIIVGDRIAPRFAHCRVGDEIKLQKRPFKVVGRFTIGLGTVEVTSRVTGYQRREVLTGEVLGSEDLDLPPSHL